MWCIRRQKKTITSTSSNSNKKPNQTVKPSRISSD